MLGLEDVAAYKDLFSPEDWNAIQTGQWDETEVSHPSPITDEAAHEVTVYDPPGEIAGNEDRFELECDRCGHIGGAAAETEAQMLAKLHETLGATQIEDVSVTR